MSTVGRIVAFRSGSNPETFHRMARTGPGHPSDAPVTKTVAGSRPRYPSDIGGERSPPVPENAALKQRFVLLRRDFGRDEQLLLDRLQAERLANARETAPVDGSRAELLQ